MCRLDQAANADLVQTADKRTLMKHAEANILHFEMCWHGMCTCKRVSFVQQPRALASQLSLSTIDMVKHIVTTLSCSLHIA